MDQSADLNEILIRDTTINDVNNVIEEKPSLLLRPGLIKRKSSLMGIAPAISEVSRPYGNTIAMQFWYGFRRLWPIMFLISTVIMFVIPYYLLNDINGYLVCGGALSIVSCIAVVISYQHILPWRRHPSSLILHRTLASLLLSILVFSFSLNRLIYKNLDSETSQTTMIITECDDRDHTSLCKATSFLVELSFLAGEFWSFTLSVDLFLSLRNPFTSYTKNMSRYHLLTWMITVFFSFLLTFQSKCQGVVLANGLCWMKVFGPLSGCLWGYFLLWVSSFYVLSLLVILFAYIRIKKGLESSYATRQSCVHDTFRIIFVYIAYLSLLAIIYSSIADYVSDGQRNLFLKHLFGYLVACRGSLDGFVWFAMHDFKHPESGPIPLIDRFVDVIYFPFRLLNYLVCSMTSGIDGDASHLSTTTPHKVVPLLSNIIPLPSENLSPVPFRLSIDSEQTSNASPPRLISPHHRADKADGSPHDDDLITDLDLSPQLNLALRRELLHFVTMGIKRSVERCHERELEAQQHRQSKLNTHESAANQNQESRMRSFSSSPSVVTNTVFSPAFQRAATMPVGSGSPGNEDSPSYKTPLRIPLNSARSFYHSGYTPSKASTQSSYRYGPYRSISTSLSEHVQRALGVATDYLTISPTKHPQKSFASTGSLVHPYEDHFYLEEKYLFKDFYPDKFQYLRQLNMIDELWYVQQIIQPTREILSAGSSGSFMFYSQQSDYIVKTVTREEANVLISILDNYIAYISNHSSTTLISQFLGLHSVTLYYNIEFIFVVMKNIFPRKRIVHERYDIKGSWIGRKANLKKTYQHHKFATCKYCNEVFIIENHLGTSIEACSERMLHHANSSYYQDLPHEACVVLKDNDLVTKIRLHPQDTVNIFETLYNDSNALCAMGITDYSLLIGVHYEASGTKGVSNDVIPLLYSPVLTSKDEHRVSGCHTLRSFDGQCTYHFGIIDILQTWTLAKRLERMYKVNIKCYPADGISCMPPAEYRDRFQLKISQIIDTSML
jgi:hypothetical protein